MVKKLNKKAAIIISIIIALPIIILLYLTLNSGDNDSYLVNPNRQVGNNNHLNLILSPILDEDAELGISLLVLSGAINNLTEIYPEGHSDKIILETPQDPLTARVGNNSESQFDFILKIFYNYKEIPFRVSGADSYETEFLFSLDSGYLLDIPLYLDESLEVDETISRLTVGIFMAPDQFSMVVEDLFIHQFSLILAFEINYGFDGELILTVDKKKPSRRIEGVVFYSLMVNQEWESAGSGVYFPPNPLQVRSEEEIELIFTTNMSGHAQEKLDSYLILSMLDWHQVPMSGQPYLLIDATVEVPIVASGEEVDSTVDQGRFTIIAPNEPGFYEFVAVIIPNPTSRASNNAFSPLEMSHRFTIEVIE